MHDLPATCSAAPTLSRRIALPAFTRTPALSGTTLGAAHGVEPRTSCSFPNLSVHSGLDRRCIDVRPGSETGAVSDALLADITELGRELVRLGWRARAESLRAFYVATLRGAPSTPAWNATHVARWRAVLGLGPHPLPVADRCRRCPAPRQQWWTGARTVLHLDDRYVSVCTGCGAEWVRLLPGSPLSAGAPAEPRSPGAR